MMVGSANSVIALSYIHIVALGILLLGSLLDKWLKNLVIAMNFSVF